jgi:NAD(P)-dependent dehydrogenase (short-subunit alcohol dehydrogenase family)
VFLGARDQARGARAVADLASEGDIRLVVLDVTDACSVRVAAQLIGGEFGRLDVLVNNAGVATGYHKPSEESADDLRYVYVTNMSRWSPSPTPFSPGCSRRPPRAS